MAVLAQLALETLAMQLGLERCWRAAAAWLRQAGG